MQMPNITIGRYEADPTALGVIKPDDDSWQVVIDKDGFPCFYVRCRMEQESPDDPDSGLVCVDDLLPAEMGPIADIMRSTFGGPLSPEEEEAAMEEHLARINAANRPCPR